MTKIAASARLTRVKRVFDPYQDRKDMVRLDRNEDPIGWDEKHLQQLRSELTAYDFAAYADSTAFTRKLARWLDVAEPFVLVTAGSDAAVKAVFETYVDPGDHVLMQEPSWRMYEVYNNIYRGSAQMVTYDRSLRLDVDDVLRRLRQTHIRLVLIANPNQPTGTLLSETALLRIIETAHASGTVVLVDEAYFLFSSVTAVPWVREFSNLIVTRTFSKAFGLAGLRLGYCVAHPDRISELSLLRPVTDSNSIALKCGEYALDHIEWIRCRVDNYIAGREFLYAQLLEAKLETFRSHANFILVQCPTAEAAKALISKARDRKYLLKGPWTAAPLENFVRISVGSLELMQQFWSDCGPLFVRLASRVAAPA